jgi:hypothetical protein
MDADVIVVGAGLAGLAAATEAAEAGARVIVVDQEGEGDLGGQAFWSFGGLFFVDSPEQRRLRIRDGLDLARRDWFGTAGFDRPEDDWPKAWAEAYLAFAAGEKRAWLHAMGVRWFPVVGWAERGGSAEGHGNSVPRFHVTWGTGPGLVEPFVRRARAAEAAGRLSFRFRHRVDGLEREHGAVRGVHGAVLAPSDNPRGAPSNRTVTADFALRAGAIVVASGGIGGNPDMVRRLWPRDRLGEPPAAMVRGVPDYVDGRMIDLAQAAGARLVNRDRMWHYVEGLRNHSPIWTDHGIRILPGPSSLWLDARGRRLPPPLYPGFDTLATLAHLRATGFDHSWFLLNQAIIRKEFALSGSEQNPDLTGRSWRGVLGRAVGRNAPAPVEAFKRLGADFVVRDRLEDLVDGMNALVGAPHLDPVEIRRVVEDRDAGLAHPFGKDLQLAAIRGARAYLGDRLIRTAPPAPILDPANGPLIAVRLNVLTRKTLGGIHADLAGRALDATGRPVPGLYAAGEAAGFGGGGMHGYRSLEGTFLGGCLFSGRIAGRHAAAAR